MALSPGWPFLVANHEIGRVDYRPVVAPAFLCEQDCSPILTMLPLSDEPEKVHLVRVRYQTANGSPCHLTVVYREQVLHDLSHFAFRPQRQVRFVSGAVLLGAGPLLGLSDSVLEQIDGLVAPTYHAFCAADRPEAAAVAASWPLCVAPLAGSFVEMPDLDCSALTFGPMSSHSLPESSQLVSFAITPEQVRKRLSPRRSFWQQLVQRLVFWRR